MTGPRHADRPVHSMSADDLEVVPGNAHESFQGWIPAVASEEDLREALEKAFDYRGDVTVIRRDGSKVEGYVFDRIVGKTLATSFVRILPKASNLRLKIAYSDITGLAFTGRDTAAGKSWEAWVRKYWEKRDKSGEKLSLQPEWLDE